MSKYNFNKFNFNNMCKLLCLILALWLFCLINVAITEVYKSQVEMHQAIAKTVLESKNITIQGTKIEFNAVKGVK